MASKKFSHPVILIIVSCIVISSGWMVYQRLQEINAVTSKTNKQQRPTPVEISTIQQKTIQRIRTFSGSIQPFAEFVVAQRVDGRVDQLLFDVSDTVTRDQVVAHAGITTSA